jgi:4-amino-4-deoxy-L-arabinose transferase-like glycosyltransferase
VRPIAGLAATAVAIGPWLVAIQRATGGEFLAGSLGHDFLSKIGGAQESHGAPPLYYLALSLVTFWPGSLYLAPALIHGWHRHEQPVVRFLLAWIVPAWVVLELVPTKLPNYALPLYPALALLAAGALVEGRRSGEPRWERWVNTAVAALWALTTLLIAGATIVLPIRFGGVVGIVVTGIVSAALIVLLAALLYRRAGNAALLAALTLVFVVPAAGRVVPHLARLWLSRDAADMVVREPGFGGVPLTVIGYNEPSLVFLLGGRVRFTMPDVAATLADGAEALVNDRQAPMFAQELAPRGLVARPLDSVHGIDYSNGQWTRLTLYRIEPK